MSENSFGLHERSELAQLGCAQPLHDRCALACMREQEINANRRSTRVAAGAEGLAEAEGASILTVAGDLLLPIPRRNAMNWPFPGSRSVAFGVNLF